MRVKIGTIRNNGGRIWVEGKNLLDTGFTCGTRYNRIMYPSGIIDLLIDPTGKYKVAGTPQRPIIDLSGAWVRRWAGTAASAFVGFYNSSISIEPNKEQ